MLKIQIIDMQMELVHKKIPVTAETLKSKILGVDERARMLIPIFQDHNNKIKELVGKEYAPGTLERYTTSLKHTIEFMQWKFNIADIDISRGQPGQREQPEAGQRGNDLAAFKEPGKREPDGEQLRVLTADAGHGDEAESHGFKGWSRTDGSGSGPAEEG